jgi:hypothetical protein
MRPVMMVVRLIQQIGWLTNAFLNKVPRDASESMFGVLAMGCP